MPRLVRRRLAPLPLPAIALAACLPPEPPPDPMWPRLGAAVRVHERGAGTSGGSLVRLTSDSLVWQPSGEAGALLRAMPLSALARVEIAQPLSQARAFKRGALRGALVGGALGGVLLAVKNDAVGGAVGITLVSAWFGGVVKGQQVEGPRPPTRWQVVHPRRR